MEYQKSKGIKSAGRVDGYDDFIFVNRNGSVQHQGTLNKALQRIMRDCNDMVLSNTPPGETPVLLPHFSCHILRHTFATRIVESGISLKVVQKILGHEDITTTMNVYVTVTGELQKQEITTFENYLNEKTL